MTWQHGTSRHERGYGARWVKLRDAALRRDHHLCHPCRLLGYITAAKAVDHILPKAEGGTDDLENLQAICDDCHREKTAEEAARAQGRAVKPRLQFDATGYPIWPE